MGHWVMVIEGSGIHDNGREDDAEVLLQEFAGKVAQHHDVHRVSFTAGSTRELLNDDETTPLRHGETAYRHRVH